MMFKKLFLLIFFVGCTSWLSSYGWHTMLADLLEQGGTIIIRPEDLWRQHVWVVCSMLLCLPAHFMALALLQKLGKKEVSTKWQLGMLVAWLVGSQLGVLLRGVDLAKKVLRPVEAHEEVLTPQVNMASLELYLWAGAGAFSAIVMCFFVLLAVAVINRDAG